MFASRLATTVRGVIPYAQWVGFAIQFGYVGYNLFKMYQAYVVQVERDARNGTERSLEETIELIVKPKRKKGKTQQQTPGSSNQIDDDVENRENCLNTQISTAIEPGENCDEQPKLGHKNAMNLSKDDEVTIVYENRRDEAGPSGQNNQQDDEVSSNASTSLESTDTSKGILRDIYSECFICTRSLNDNKKPVATLPFCMHPFHQSCLDGVLKWHPKCPVCDYHIFSPI